MTGPELARVTAPEPIAPPTVPPIGGATDHPPSLTGSTAAHPVAAVETEGGWSPRPNSAHPPETQKSMNPLLDSQVMP